ncbi:hypothetical protein PV963_16585 [Streptomyces coeruleorubidus]|nr:hypothetical protein [Streptomyces coeruleorubidus]WDV57077.1 hypothetical protein PV963_16585 [Streptomyces coeruleorubidus]
MDAQDTAERLRRIGDEMSERFYERADVVRTLASSRAGSRRSSSVPRRR